eukprot:6185768-Pleurochrysis_carterae.AAC.1
MGSRARSGRSFASGFVVLSGLLDFYICPIREHPQAQSKCEKLRARPMSNKLSVRPHGAAPVCVT